MATNTGGIICDPIQMVEECWENQRWNPIGGFSDKLLPSDRYRFSSEDGTKNRDQKLISLPSDAWRWNGNWQVEHSFENEVLDDGWSYAVDFPGSFCPKMNLLCCVRRRKWFRIREYVPSKRWNLAPSINRHKVSLCSAWAVGTNGEVYFRENSQNLDKSDWEMVEGSQGVSGGLTVSDSGTPFAITRKGDLLYRQGVTPSNPRGRNWATAKGPPGKLSQLSAGKESLWVITTKGKCWFLKQKLKDVLSSSPEAPLVFEWMEIPGKIKAISVSKSDLVVLAIGNKNGIVLNRTGITDDDLQGKDWTELNCTNSRQRFSSIFGRKTSDGKSKASDSNIKSEGDGALEASSEDQTEVKQGHHPTLTSTAMTLWELKVYHPLSHGFLPGSSLVIDLVISPDAKYFAINLSASKNNAPIFKFKSEFDDQSSRSSRTPSRWYLDEPEVEFPFSAGQAYTVTISCETDHLSTHVRSRSANPKQSTDAARFLYKHRVHPENITHLTVEGDTEVAGVFYDARTGTGNIFPGGSHVEFRLNPALCPFGGSNDSAIIFSKSAIHQKDKKTRSYDSFPFPEVKESSSPLSNRPAQIITYRQIFYLFCNYVVKTGIDRPADMLSTIEKNEKLGLLEGQCGQSPALIDLDKWLVYCRLQREHPTVAAFFLVLPPLFSSLLGQYKNGDLAENEIRAFWVEFYGLIDDFADFVTNCWKESVRKDWIGSLCLMLQLMEEHLLPVSNQFLWHKLEQALFTGAVHFATSIISSEISNNTNHLKQLTNIGRTFITDLKSSCRFPGKNVFGTTYLVYDDKYSNLVVNSLKQMTSDFKAITQTDFDGDLQREIVATRYSQRDLYLTVKEFAGLPFNSSSEWILSNPSSLRIAPHFHSWFEPLIHRWLDVASLEVKALIKKTVWHKDEGNVTANTDLKPNSNFNSSALHVASIFEDIFMKSIWRHLSWPEVEAEINFACRILKDINICIAYYAQLLTQKFEDRQASQRNESTAQSSAEIEKLNAETMAHVCSAVSDLDYLSEQLKSISITLKMDIFTTQVKEQNSSDISQPDQERFQTVLESANDAITIQMQSILQKLDPAIWHFLQEEFPATANLKDVPNKDNQRTERLVEYLYDCIIGLKRNLSAPWFTIVHSIVWGITLAAMNRLVQNKIAARCPADIFKRISCTLAVLEEFFFPADLEEDALVASDTLCVDKNKKLLEEIREILQVQGASTAERLFKNTMERYNNEAQVAQAEKAPTIAVRIAFIETKEILRIEILNCRRLKIKRKKVESFVKVKLLLSEELDIPSKKTKSRKTDYPLFDETFDIGIPVDKMSLAVLISFRIFNGDKLVGRELVGEAFVPLELVPSIAPDHTNINAMFGNLPQQQLPLTLSSLDSKATATAIILKTLKTRTVNSKAAGRLLKFVKQISE